MRTTCFYYEQQIKGELQRIHISGLTIETRLIVEIFDCVMDECDLEAVGVPSIFKLIRSDSSSLVRMLSTLDLKSGRKRSVSR